MELRNLERERERVGKKKELLCRYVSGREGKYFFESTETETDGPCYSWLQYGNEN